MGTLAQLRQVDTLDDGRYDIVVNGASRFRILDVLLGKPYLMGAIDYLEEIPSEPDSYAHLVEQVSKAFTAYLTNVRQTDQPLQQVDLPADPELLSYMVAAALQVDIGDKQRLLEMDSSVARLRQGLRLLRRESLFADKMSLSRNPRSELTYSPN